MHVLILHGIQAEAGSHWMRWLGHKLDQDGHRVHMPQLPAADHPDRFDWLRFVKTILLDVPPQKLVIIGHSLGVVTALDYIEQSSNPIHGLISISGFAREYGSELNAYFMKEKELDFIKIRAQVEKKAVLYGDNDPYVTQTALQQLADELQVLPQIFPQGGHLNSESGYEEFPELYSIAVEFCKEHHKKK